MGGFEPPTAWFVARYSIQLSYIRTSLQPLFSKYGARGRIRTSDRLVRSQVLYPAELHAQISYLTEANTRNNPVYDSRHFLFLVWCGWEDSNLRPPGS